MENKHLASFKTYVFLALLAAELLMSFTFLGYLHIPPISITFAYIPVLLAGCFLGVSQSTAVGFLFGLASLYKASAYYVQPFDKLFSPFLSGAPLQSILLSVGTRTLFGFLIGLLFLAAKRNKHPRLWIGILSLLAAKLHAFLVYTALMLLFPEAGYHASNTLSVTLSDAIISLVCLFLVEWLWRFSQRPFLQKFSRYAIHFPNHRKRLPIAWIIFLVCSTCAAVAAAYYFSYRTAYMLGTYGVHLSSNINHDLLHLQIQFLVAELALNLILILLLLLVYQYLSYQEYLEGLDALTGVMGRKMFLQHCNTLENKQSTPPEKMGWFIFVDVDHFKFINDNYGHPAGDTVLKDIAAALSHTFSAHGKVGRMGGDEFAVILEDTLSSEEVSAQLDDFLACISHVLPGTNVTCSAGAFHFSYPFDMRSVYAATDQLLYAAKNKGRACYVLGSCDGTETNVLASSPLESSSR